MSACTMYLRIPQGRPPPHVNRQALENPKFVATLPERPDRGKTSGRRPGNGSSGPRQPVAPLFPLPQRTTNASRLYRTRGQSATAASRIFLRISSECELLDASVHRRISSTPPPSLSCPPQRFLIYPLPGRCHLQLVDAAAARRSISNPPFSKTLSIVRSP